MSLVFEIRLRWVTTSVSLVSKVQLRWVTTLVSLVFEFRARWDTTLTSPNFKFWVWRVTTLVSPKLRALSSGFIKNTRLSFKVYHGHEELSNYVMKWCYIKIMWKLLLLWLDRCYLVVHSESFHIIAIVLPDYRHKHIENELCNQSCAHQVYSYMNIWTFKMTMIPFYLGNIPK